MVVSLLQAGALGAQLMQSLSTADRLNLELGARVGALEATNAEVRTLNEQLRHQVSSRSRELAETLARVGSLNLPALALEPGHVVRGPLLCDPVPRRRRDGVGLRGHEGERRQAPRAEAPARQVDGRRPRALRASEAHLASEIDHPNIVRVVDIDMTPEGVLYLVMEYVEGRALEDMLDADPALAWSIVALRQVAEGLAAIHASGIVHRDLKPANVLVEEHGAGAGGRQGSPTSAWATLLDRVPPRDGRGRRGSGERRAHDPPGARHGDARVQGARDGRRQQDARPPVDGHVAAFGVMAHELLVGRPPFRDPLYVRRLHGRSLPPPPPLSVARPRIDPAVASLVDRCLSLDPARRPSAREAAQTLAAARLDGDPSSSVQSVRAAPRA